MTTEGYAMATTLSPNAREFADACCAQSTIAELRKTLAAPTAEMADCRTWKITIREWRAACAVALSELLARSDEAAR